MLKEYKIIDINDYRKLKFIGKGTFSNVYRVQEKTTGKIYAAKVLQDLYGDEESKSEERINKMQSESPIYSRLNHPAITKFYGVCPYDFDNEPYPTLILEYLPKGCLYKIIQSSRKGEPLPPKWNHTKILINIFGIASGVAYMHSNNVLYRDLKPLNVLLDDNYYPKLTDFGFSKIFTDENQKHTKGIGSPLYMAPETIQGNEYYTTAIDSYFKLLLLFTNL